MSSYGYCFNNPVNLIDPSGMVAVENDDLEWKPKIVLKKDSKGDVTGGYLALQKNGGVLYNKINSIAPSKWAEYGIK